MSVTDSEIAAITVAPRVTPELLEANIVSEFYFTAGDGVRGESEMGTSPAGRASNLELLTFCVLVLANGFTVTGQSACASAANFNRDIGRRLARDHAVKQVWELMGYELRTKLVLLEEANPATLETAQTYIGTKIVHAIPMNRHNYMAFRHWRMPDDENGADEGYLIEYADGGEPNVKNFRGYMTWSPKEVFEKSYKLI